jgi:GNAT superfamily N-acetyltransferase
MCRNPPIKGPFMKALHFELFDQAPAASLAAVDAGLGAFNLASAPLGEVRPLACMAHDDGAQVIGGAVGRTWGACGELQQMWVDERWRNEGVATHLMALWERGAAERGCTLLYLETFSFQAPDFYLRLGYERSLQIEGFAPSISKFVMIKRLTAAAPRAA